MTAHPAPSSAAPQAAAPSGGVDDVELELQRELFILQRAAEVGLLVIESIGRQASQTSAPPPAQVSADAADPPPPASPPRFEGDVALAYDRVTRAMRLTVILKARLRGERAARTDAAARAAQNAARAAAAAREERRLARGRDIAGALTGIIAEAVQAEAQAIYDAADAAGHGPDTALTLVVVDDPAAPTDLDGGELETLEQLHERLIEEAGDRLDRERLDVLTRPASEIIAGICADLGLAPDWLRLAEQDWAQQEIASGRPGAPLRDLRAPPASSPAGAGRDPPPPRPPLRRRLPPDQAKANGWCPGTKMTMIPDGFVVTLPTPPQTPKRGRRRPR